MKKILMLTMFTCAMFFTQAQNPNWMARTVGTAGVAATTLAVGLDNSGNTYAAGSFQGSPTWQGGAMTAVGTDLDIWVAKYNSSGALQWKFREGNAGLDEAKGIAVDPTQTYLYVTGRIDGNVTFYGTPGGATVALTSYGSQDIFLAKYLLSNGNLVWAKNAGSTYPDAGNAIAINSTTNDILITGMANTNFGPATFSPLSLTAPNSKVAFVAKCTAAGSWAAVIPAGTGAGFESMAYGITLDASNNIYITGDAYSGSTWAGATVPTPSGQSGLFVSKVNSAFTGWSWVGVSKGTPIIVGASGITYVNNSLYITGIFAGTSLVIGSTTLPLVGNVDILVASISTSGTWGWAKNAGTTDYDYATGITNDGSNLYLTGKFGGVIGGNLATFGSITVTSAGISDAYIARMTTGGVFTCVKTGGGSKQDGAYAINALGKDLVFGGGFASDNFLIAGNLYSAQNYASDAFIQHYKIAGITPYNQKICPGSSILLTATGGSSYTWSPPTGLSATTGTSVLATPPAPITYTVTAASTYGCSATATTTIGFNPAAIANAGPDITINICAFPSASIGTANPGGYTYIWNPATWLNNAYIAQPTVTPTSYPTTVVYTVYAVNAYGCTASDQVAVHTSCLYPRIGEDEMAQVSSPSIYPNPGNGMITASLDFVADVCEVRDVSGKLVKTIVIDSGERSLNLQTLKAGVYMLNFKGKAQAQTFKFIKTE